jgi:pyruvate, water dikinase
VILSLDDPGRIAALVGPKAAALACLRHAGLPVPNAFALAAPASEVHLREARVAQEVERLFETVDSGGEWRRLAIAVRASLSRTPVPLQVADALRTATRRLRPPLAVRSSALVEDSARATFAGLFTTFLGVMNTDDLLTAVRACWVSRFSDIVIRYAVGRGAAENLRRSAMAVIVQEAIDARSAGSAVSIDPTGAIVISGAWGLGRAVAESQVVPDWWRVDRQDFTLRERRNGSKPLAARLDPRGGEVWRHQTQRRSTAVCLDDRTLQRLAVLVVEAERVFGSPREVEWALDRRQRLWVLQARPFTSVRTVEPTADSDPVIAWLRRGSVLEGQPTSPGQVIGRARRLSNAAGIGPGDVLIAGRLLPGMAAVLAGVGGLVVETGGSTGHAATLARERGIPAIFGARCATRAIPDGALILVDGTLGCAWYRLPDDDSSSPGDTAEHSAA